MNLAKQTIRRVVPVEGYGNKIETLEGVYLLTQSDLDNYTQYIINQTLEKNKNIKQIYISFNHDEFNKDQIIQEIIKNL